ncbi:MAG: ATP-binding protein [Planctomycetes bacterium]|nr:ATP-binding protein [Planctomycetota bacterium]
MRVPPEFGVSDDRFSEIVVASDLRSVKQPEARILNALLRNNYSEESTFAIKLALEEALTNGVKHGNRGDAKKTLTVRFYIDAERVVIMVRDQGAGFVPDLVPDPTADENLERPSGRGIMLMHAYMTRICFNETGNEVWMYKENRPESA